MKQFNQLFLTTHQESLDFIQTLFDLTPNGYYGQNPKKSRAVHNMLKLLYFFTSILILLINPKLCLATQVHSHPEGLYVHQLAHFFFILSMVTLIYWLKKRNLYREKGWRYLKYSALCFIIWNIDAILAHYLENQNFFIIKNAGSLEAVLVSLPGYELHTLIFYFAKMDHIFCVPGILFLYFALRCFIDKARELK
ncbi:hypothetical protein [Desulfonauticus submarinus]|uniref:hypothetical protein n=1 Tax=Desulfonauticus submarinus TaxID=206665 RepID=UPI001177DB9A|nr:hypothetical protein [Desulfonauticus submarinus]